MISELEIEARQKLFNQKFRFLQSTTHFEILLLVLITLELINIPLTIGKGITHRVPKLLPQS